MQPQKSLFAELSELEQSLVLAAWEGASRAYIPESNFRVGSALLAKNTTGNQRIFSGGNIENFSWGSEICSERTAIFSACAAGFPEIEMFAVVFPTAHTEDVSPCGICRQVMRERAPHADFLSVINAENTVIRRPNSFWLPEEAVGKVQLVENVNPANSVISEALAALKESYAPYSGLRAGAAVEATNGRHAQIFTGSKSENAACGAATSAVEIAVNKALSAGFQSFTEVAVSHESRKPKDETLVLLAGDDLQVLTEGGMDATIMNVSPNGKFMRSGSLAAFLPLAFGKHSLAAK
jgi:cytidine deaminase